MLKRFFISAAGVAVLLLATPGSSRAADICTSVGGNIVQNCGFETGDFTGWSAGGWSVNTGFAGVVPNSGSFYVETGCVGPTCINTPDAYFYQDIATNSGSVYDLSFYYAPNNSNELQVLWGDAGPLVPTPADTGSCVGGTNCIFDTTAGGGTSYSQITVTGILATSNLMRLEFLGRNDPTWNGVDSISLVQSGAAGVPEPSTVLLLAGGLAGIFLRRRRA